MKIDPLLNGSTPHWRADLIVMTIYNKQQNRKNIFDYFTPIEYITIFKYEQLNDVN